jgi:hypothetical protein
MQVQSQKPKCPSASIYCGPKIWKRIAAVRIITKNVLPGIANAASRLLGGNWVISVDPETL